MNEEIANPLIDAMMLLEMILEPSYGYPADEMTWAAHSLVQHAWQRSTGREETALPAATKELLAKIHADSAIENAMAKWRKP